MKPNVTALMGLACVMFVSASAQQPEVEPGQRVASFEMTWTQRSPEMIMSRVQAAAEVMAGRRLERGAKADSTRSSKEMLHRIRLRLPDAPSLEAVYLPEYDELRIGDQELAASTSPKSEISQEEAIGIAKHALEALAQRNLVDLRHFNWEKADIASTWVGGGSIDGKAQLEKHRLEYRITLRRTVNGIEVANAGIRLGIHISGRISSVRLGGVSVASKPGATGLEEPTGTGRWMRSSATIADIRSRFAREMVPAKAKPRVAWSRVMYVMPENKRTALVQPLYVVSYSLEFPSDEGNTVVSRRMTVGFSLVDPKALPIDLTPPTHLPVTEEVRKSIKP